MELKDLVYCCITILSLLWAVSSFFITMTKTRENEKLKLYQDKKIHISKSLFEYEFDSCKKLMGLLELMIDANCQMFPHLNREYGDKEKEKERRLSLYRNSNETRNAFIVALGEARPFIDDSLYDGFNNLQQKCWHQIVYFEDFKINDRTDEYINSDRSDYRNCFKYQDELQADYEKVSLLVKTHFKAMAE